ncbi:MAG: sialidase family protein [Lentisphaeria bacterium]
MKVGKSPGGVMAIGIVGFGLCGILLAGHDVHGASGTGAEWQVEVVGYGERVIYHSPETPGFTEWASLWQLPDGRLRCSFLQLTGPLKKPLASFPLLESNDNGGTWNRVDVNQILVDCVPATDSGPGYWSPSKIAPWFSHGVGMAVLADGTLIKTGWPPWGRPSDESGYVERSEDGGKTWGGKIFFLPKEEYQTWPTIIHPLRDGRLVLMAGCWKRGDNALTPYGKWGNMTKMMFISADKGKTWSKPIILMPTHEGSCEESDFCELPNGDLFWIHRAEHFPDHPTTVSPFAAMMGLSDPPKSYWYSDRMQGITHKKGETFIPGRCEPAALPHASRPNLIYTQEGIILYFTNGGSYWTANLGKTWSKLNIPSPAYNPVGMQMKNGTIIIMGHNGHDAPYGSINSPIKQQTFRLKVTAPADIAAGK